MNSTDIFMPILLNNTNTHAALRNIDCILNHSILVVDTKKLYPCKLGTIKCTGLGKTVDQ